MSNIGSKIQKLRRRVINNFRQKRIEIQNDGSRANGQKCPLWGARPERIEPCRRPKVVRQAGSQSGSTVGDGEHNDAAVDGGAGLNLTQKAVTNLIIAEICRRSRRRKPPRNVGGLQGREST